MILNALIADDEEASRAQLLSELRPLWPELRIVSEAASGVDAWDAFLEYEPQICLLDVRMPGLTGIEVAQRIRGAAHIVFVAAPGDRVLAAFDERVDHVLKPVDRDALAPVMERVKSRVGSAPPDLTGLLEQLSGQIRRPAPLDVIQGGSGRDLTLVNVSDVIYFEAEGRSTRVVREGGDLLIRTQLKELVGELDEAQFLQIHRSVIVNRRFLGQAIRVDAEILVVALHGRPEKLPVARHFQHAFETP